MKKIFYFICLIIWLYLIYYLSNQNGVTSGGNSGNIIRYFLELFNFNNGNIELFIDIIHNSIRELMHITEYFVLGFLVIKNLHNFKIKENIYLITLMFNFIYASTDEIHQLFISGRSFQFYDILMDMLGTILIVLLFNIKFMRKDKVV